MKIGVLIVMMILVIVAGVNFTPALAVTIDSDLDSNQLSGNNHFRIYFTTDCTAHPNKCVTNADVNDMDAQLEDIYDIYTDASGDFRFNDPTRGNEFPIQIRPTDGGGMAYCTGSDCGISLAPAVFTNPLSLEGIPLHEMLHQVQWTYTFGWSGFVTEGTARMMQDKLYNDLDQSIGTEMAAYFPQANHFLDNLTDNTLIDQSYSACLFWTYLTEQYGTITTEPQLGVDAVRTLFENHGSGSDDIQRTNAALGTLSPGTTFKDVFMNFIVANYTKNLTGPGVPPEYRYTDDDTLPGSYHNPALTLNRTMPVGDVFSATDEIRAWAAQYYEARPDAGVPIISMEFRQVSDVSLVYNLLVIKNNDLVMDACEFNVQAKDFVRSLVNDSYDRVVVVVGALDHPAALRYTFSTGGGIPTLNILWPRAGHEAVVDKDDLNTFHVHLEVVGPGGSVLSGLEPDDFEVTVDTTSFDIVTGAEVMGQYWLVVQPENLGTGLYDLQVSLAAGTLTDTETNAVRFRDMVNADNVVVIDRSGSMLEPDWSGPYWETPDPTDKIYGAIDAGTLYANSFRTGDQLGLVWFSNDATTAKALMDFNETNRDDFIDEIDTFDEDESGAWRATSIGDGLWNAQDELDDSGDATHDWVIILLSDGLENQPRTIDEVVCDGCKIDYVNSTSNPNTTRTVIHTVALGSNADREKLEQLAHKSGGQFEYVIEPASGDLPNDLADVYRLFAETTLLEQRIAAIRGQYSVYPAYYPTHTIQMESGATEATFVVNYNWKGMTFGGIPKVTLLNPGNQEVAPTYIDDTHRLFKIPLPQSGSWTVKLENPCSPGTEFCHGDGLYLIEVSVKSKATLEAFLGIPPEERVIGAHLPILAFLTDTQPITGATVRVQITTPELETAVAILPSEVNNLYLYDDGHHGDGKANDGIYGGIFRNTDRAGVYNMKIMADGNSPLVGDFIRETKLAFNMRGDTDADGDGLPDGWEDWYGLNPKDPGGDHGAQGDPDGDGLTNDDEFDLGTDPLDPDTDDGGENDGSEVTAGRDPYNPEDDAVRPPTSLRAIPDVNAVILVIGYLPEHDYLIVYRATNPEGPWESFGIQPTDRYTDPNLVNEVTYYYKVIGVDQQQYPNRSVPTRVVSATPKADPMPPSGFIVINDGAELTETENVTLQIWADPDTIEMKIANDPDFTGAVWEAFSMTKDWSLLPGTGLRTVYVLFKDAADNIGPRSPYDPSVEIQPAMDTIVLGSLIEATKEIEAFDRIEETPMADVFRGDIFTYHIEIENPFEQAVYLLVNDTLDEYIDYVADSFRVNGELADNAYFSSGDLEYPDHLLGVDELLSIDFDVKVQAIAPIGWIIENSAWIIAYTDPLNIPGSILSITETNITQGKVVPEASTLILLGAGVLGLFVVMRRRLRTKR